MATNYQRGRAFEYRARDKALKLGAEYVMRAASSKGAADLIVLWPKRMQEPITDEWSVWVERTFGKTWVVQCKRDGRLPKAEREQLIEIAERTGAVPVLARVPKSGRGVEFINLNTMEALVG